MRYDVSANPLLDDESKALLSRDPLGFAEQNELAETLLGIDTFPDVPFADDTPNLLLTKATRAVAIQVNWQVNLGTDGYTLQSGDPAEIRRTFRSVKGNQPILDPRAAAIIATVLDLYEEENETDPDAGFSRTVRAVR